jgi:hypothetical protein
VVGFRNTVGGSLYTCFSIVSISAETMFYCVGIVSCLSDAMTLLFLSLDHVYNVANERRNSKCVFYVKTKRHWQVEEFEYDKLSCYQP